MYSYQVLSVGIVSTEMQVLNAVLTSVHYIESVDLLQRRPPTFLLQLLLELWCFIDHLEKLEISPHFLFVSSSSSLFPPH